jgi:acyltransferase
MTITNSSTSLRPQRIPWVDLAKAFAIFLVLIGHMTVDVGLKKYIYSFHLPLFFWISGYLFNDKKFTEFQTFFKRRIFTLVVPYFIFSVFSILFCFFVVGPMSIRGETHALNPWFPFIGIFYGVAKGYWRNPINPALWFLPCLFITEMIFWLVQRYFNKIVYLFMIILCGVVGFCIRGYISFRLPWGLDVAFNAVVFYAIGNSSKNLLDKLVALQWRWKAGLLILLITGSIGISMLNGKVEMSANEIQNPFLFYFAALCGIFFWLLIIRNIPPINIALFLGQNTITIIGLYGVSDFVLRGMFFAVKHKLPNLDNIGMLSVLMYSILQILILLPIILLINRYLPFILGRKNIKK